MVGFDTRLDVGTRGISSFGAGPAILFLFAGQLSVLHAYLYKYDYIYVLSLKNYLSYGYLLLPCTNTFWVQFKSYGLELGPPSEFFCWAVVLG